MPNWKVIKEFDSSGEDWTYRIEDVTSTPGVYPFVQHEVSPLRAYSLDELRSRLRAMLKATEKPMLEMTQPRLIEVKAKSAA